MAPEGDALARALDQGQPRSGSHRAEALDHASGPGHFECAARGIAQPEDELGRGLTHEAAAEGQHLGLGLHSATAALSQGQAHHGARCVTSAGRAGEAHLDEAGRDRVVDAVVAIEAMTCPSDVVHEQVEVAVVVEVGGHRGPAVIGVVDTRDSREVGEVGAAIPDEELVPFKAAEREALLEDHAHVFLLVRLAPGLLGGHAFDFFHGGRHHVAPVEASCVCSGFTADEAVGHEHVEATVEIEVDQAR